ncbi:hypothetical protein EDWATA_00101 [Edwardsiella tarda ATCC 23685]|uniref:Uncharacterized protein n=1 Tax=Edwardsiella tarda ATCC 23685 TaxID=500638 RepID=D4F078_EDWTA|nr:hypothetical protein EDWATA_00101 [Edwardsiella tarda ATCC 23685]
MGIPVEPLFSAALRRFFCYAMWPLIIIDPVIWSAKSQRVERRHLHHGLLPAFFVTGGWTAKRQYC